MCDTLTRVVFRTWPDGDVIALFPDDAWDSYGNVSSYEHVGQHGAADYARVVSRTRPATPSEYADLACELEWIGYALRVVECRWVRPAEIPSKAH